MAPRFGRAAFASLLVLVGLAASFVPSSAGAQQNDDATARALFDEARALMRAGSYGSACPKLEAASKLFAGSGVLLNLGDCYEHLGRTASASAAFAVAAAAAMRLGRREDEAEAKRRLAALEPKLSRVSVRVRREAPGMVLKRGDVVIERATWGASVAVDPGPQILSAEAPGRAPWSTTIDVSTPGRTLTVEVPELKPVPTAPTPPVKAPPTIPEKTPPATAEKAPPSMTESTPPAPEGAKAANEGAPPPSPGSTQRMVGGGLAAAGVVTMAIGGILALGAKSMYDTAAGETGAQRHDDSLKAVSQADTATVVFGAGAAVAIAGGIVWLVAPRAPAAVTTDGRSLLLHGTF